MLRVQCSSAGPNVEDSSEEVCKDRARIKSCESGSLPDACLPQVFVYSDAVIKYMSRLIQLSILY